MKKMVVVLGVLVSAACISFVVDQNNEGVIQYETKVNMHRNLPKEREELKAMIPEFRTMKDQLFFNSEESLYKPLEEDEPEENFGGGGMQIRLRRPSVEIYVNRSNAQRLVRQEFMGKNYLIEDSLSIAPWKFGSETKEVLGHLCRQAYYSSERDGRTQEITAWFTDKIRPFLGPEGYNTLPGAVLAVDINNGERIIVATKIDIRELKKNELKTPSGGTRVTQEELNKLVAEQTEKMRANGGVVIRN